MNAGQPTQRATLRRRAKAGTPEALLDAVAELVLLFRLPPGHALSATVGRDGGVHVGLFRPERTWNRRRDEL